MRKSYIHISQKTVHSVAKALFSFVIIQLLYASLCLSGEMPTPAYAVPVLLEYAAASACMILAGLFAFEYFCFNKEN